MILLRIIVIFLLLASTLSAKENINLSLKDAKILALENNRDIQIDRKNIEIFRGDIKKEKGAFDSVLNFSSSYTDSEMPTVSTFVQSGTINQREFVVEGGVSGNLTTGTFYDLFKFSLNRTETDSLIESLSPSLTTNLSFSIGQELLRNFGKAVNKTPIYIASRNFDIALDQFKNTVSDVILSVERDYWLLVAAIKNLELEKKGLELALDLQNRNEIQVEVGVLAPVAVTQARSEVAAREVDLINADNLLEQSQDRLKNRLVLPLDSNIVPTDDPDKNFVDLNESGVLETAFENRSELKQAENEIKKSGALASFYSNQRLPRLAVEGLIQFQGLGGDENTNRLIFGGDPEPIQSQFNNQSDSFDNLFGRDFPTWTILGVLSFPIFNRTARGEYIKARADLDKKTVELKRLRESIALEVRNSIREVKNSIRSIDATRVAVELAEEVVNNEEEKLKVGLATTRDVLEAQRDLIDAQTAEIRAITQYRIALANLERAKGTILESNGFLVKKGNVILN